MRTVFVLVLACNKSPKSEPVPGWFCIWGENNTCTCYNEALNPHQEGERHPTCPHRVFGEDRCWAQGAMQGTSECYCNLPRRYYDGSFDIAMCPPK